MLIPYDEAQSITGCAGAPALCGHWLCQWERAIFDPPQNRHPSTDHQKICHRWLRRRPLRLCQIRCKSVHGGFWAHGWNMTKIIFIYALFLRNSPTAAIPTKFCTVIKTIKCPWWVVPTHALKIQDGGQPLSWKNRKNVISQPRLERFWRNLVRWYSSTLLTVPTVKNLKFQKSKMAAAAIFKNRKIAISRPQFQQFQRNLAGWLSSALMTVWSVTNFKFK